MLKFGRHTGIFSKCRGCSNQGQIEKCGLKGDLSTEGTVTVTVTSDYVVSVLVQLYAREDTLYWRLYILEISDAVRRYCYLLGPVAV